MEKKISVIVPIYKVEKYLDKCIESIINQTYQNIEIILVDDGSPDDCGLICDEWAKKDSRIIVIHKENGGLSSARNVGLDIAKGEYIGFVDSDDYIEPNMYYELVKELEANDSDLSICNFYKEDEYGNIEKNNFHNANKTYQTEDGLALLSSIGYGRYVVAWNKLYKKVLFDDIRFPLGKLHEDQAVMHYVFNKCKMISTTDKFLYHYIFRKGSIMSASFSIKSLDEADAIFDRIEFYKSNNYLSLLPAVESVLYWYMGVFTQKAISFGNLKKSDIRVLKDYKHKCWEFFNECQILKNYTEKEISQRTKVYSISFVDRLLMKHSKFYRKFLTDRLLLILKKVYKTYKAEGFSKLIKRIFNKLFRKNKNVIKIQKNKIVFNNFNGLGYDGDPKAIAEQLLKSNKKFDLVWLVRKQYLREFKFPNRIRIVEISTDRAIQELSTCKLFISNVRAGFFVKRKGQKYIQTWHGGCALKKIEKDCEDKLDSRYLKEAKLDSKNIDYIISNSKSFTKIVKRAFWTNAKILECGSPREDVYFNDNISYRNLIRQSLGVGDNEIMVLYAPTFRQDRSMKAYDLDYSRVIGAIEYKYKKKCKFFVKLHPNVIWKSNEYSIPDTVLNLTLYPNIQELMLANDILITDYSTLMFENGMLRKPTFLYASDLASYSKDRSFYFDIKKLPYKLSENNNELEGSILSFDLSQYLKDNDSFLSQDIGLIKSGTASKKVAGLIDKICSGVKQI